MALGDLHIFTGEEYVDTELAPLLNENFNSLKEYMDDASRWQVMPVQFKGTNAKFLIHETTLGTGTTQVLPLVVLDNTDIAKFSACSLKVVMSTKNGSIAAVNCDINLQKVHNSNECNVNFNTTNSDDAKAEPCTFTYNNIKYAGLKLTTGNADTLWVSGYTTEEWIAPVVDTSVTNLVTLGSDMNVIPTLFKSLQTDKSPVNDYDVVNKKSLNDLTNIKTYSQLSQIGLSGGVLDNSPYAIGNALPANSMLIVGIGGEGNTYNYPSQTGNLTVVRAHTNHVFYEITTESGNGYAVNYVLQFSIDTASEDTNYVWKRVLTGVDTGYWQANEEVEAGDMRYLAGRDNTGYLLEYVGSGTTGQTQPVVPELTEVANYSAVDRVGKMRMIFNLAEKDVDEILAAGVLYNRATYEELWNYVQLKPSLLISEAEWQAKYAQTNGKFVPYYSEGDGSTTFRTPLLSAYPCGVSNSDDIGIYKEYTIKKHNHAKIVDPITSKELYAIYGTEDGSRTDSDNFSFHNFGNIADYANTIKTVELANVGDEETRPKTMYGIWVIKAVGVIVDSIGNTDLTNVLNAVETVQSEISNLENKVNDLHNQDKNFTIIYPNGGTKESPADVTLDKVYIENNPFPGYYVDCKVQIYSSEKNMWLEQPLWWSNGSYGVYAYLERNTDKIYVTTGDTVLVYGDARGGSGINLSSNITTAPCRVLVHKLAKIESEE